MDVVTGLLSLVNWKSNSYNSILVIVNWLTKMVYYEPIKVTIDTLRLAIVILDVVIQNQDLLDSIITDRSLFFTSKFWSSLYYFLNIKHKLLTAFHLQMDGQTK